MIIFLSEYKDFFVLYCWIVFNIVLIVVIFRIVVVFVNCLNISDIIFVFISNLVENILRFLKNIVIIDFFLFFEIIFNLNLFSFLFICVLDKFVIKLVFNFFLILYILIEWYEFL